MFSILDWLEPTSRVSSQLNNGETSSAKPCPTLHTHMMSRVLPHDLHEAEQLLRELRSWTEEEVEELPKFYREKAKEYRRLTNSGEG